MLAVKKSRQAYTSVEKTMIRKRENIVGCNRKQEFGLVGGVLIFLKKAKYVKATRIPRTAVMMRSPV